MSKYRKKEALEVGSGDEVTETLLEITPLATFDSVVNIDDLCDAVLEDYDEREAANAQSKVNEAPQTTITTASIEIRPTETGTCLS